MKTDKMKTFEEDKELKSLVKDLKLETPGHNFTVKIMNIIFRENSVLERLKNERIFGKGFWIILILFVSLLAVVLVFTLTGTSGASDIPEVLGRIDTRNVTQGYESFFNKLGTIPVSIAGILLASSILLFAERFISSKNSPHKK